MTLGIVEPAFQLAGPALTLLLTPPPADADALPPALAPIFVLLLCAGAGVGTYLLLPNKRFGAGPRGTGGALVILAAVTLALLLIRHAVDRSEAGVGVYFWIFAFIALAGAVRVVTHPKPVYAALYFVLTVFASAGLFVLLWAEFMAAALVLIYAGAILVTYVFVIMLAASSTQGGAEKLAEHDAFSRDPVIASAVGFALMGVLLFVIFDQADRRLPRGPGAYTYVATQQNGERTITVTDEVIARSPAAAQASIPAGLTPADPNALPQPAFTTQALGRYLFREQGVNLELAGLILTLGMIGAILIARRRVIIAEGSEPPVKEVFTAPATPVNDDPYSIPVYGTDNPRQKAYPET